MNCPPPTSISPALQLITFGKGICDATWRMPNSIVLAALYADYNTTLILTVNKFHQLLTESPVFSLLSQVEGIRISQPASEPPSPMLSTNNLGANFRSNIRL